MTKEFDLKLQKGNLNKSVLGHPSIYMSLSVNKHERIVGQLYSWFKTIIAIVISTTKHMNTWRVFLFISGSGSGKADINSLTWSFHLRQHENRNQPQVFVCERTQLGKNFVSSGHICTTYWSAQSRFVNLWFKTMLKSLDLYINLMGVS